MKHDEINIEELKICMVRRGMNQRTLSKAAGIVPNTMNRILKGDTSPTLKTVRMIAEALEMTPLQFTQVFYSNKGDPNV